VAQRRAARRGAEQRPARWGRGAKWRNLASRQRLEGVRVMQRTWNDVKRRALPRKLRLAAAYGPVATGLSAGILARAHVWLGGGGP
jgi:hypothetical protein